MPPEFHQYCLVCVTTITVTTATLNFKFEPQNDLRIMIISALNTFVFTQITAQLSRLETIGYFFPFQHKLRLFSNNMEYKKAQVTGGIGTENISVRFPFVLSTLQNKFRKLRYNKQGRLKLNLSCQLSNVQSM